MTAFFCSLTGRSDSIAKLDLFRISNRSTYSVLQYITRMIFGDKTTVIWFEGFFPARPMCARSQLSRPVKKKVWCAMVYLRGNRSSFFRREWSRIRDQPAELEGRRVTRRGRKGASFIYPSSPPPANLMIYADRFHSYGHLFDRWYDLIITY